MRRRSATGSRGTAGSLTAASLPYPAGVAEPALPAPAGTGP